jgi:hypothetical protein
MADESEFTVIMSSVDDDHDNIMCLCTTVHLQVLKFDVYIFTIFFVNYITEKPRPDGLALAFQEGKPGQSRHEAVTTARPIWARLGLAYGLRRRSQAGPCTALNRTSKH